MHDFKEAPNLKLPYFCQTQSSFMQHFRMSSLSMNLYYTQFSKNHDLLRVAFKQQIIEILDFEHLKQAYSLYFLNRGAKNCEHDSSSDFDENDEIIYVLLCFLSIYEIDKNRSHFEFVHLFTCSFIFKY